MKEVAVLLLLVLLLSGCGSNQTPAQQAYGGDWEAAMSGGIADSSGFSFNTEFTVGSNGVLTIASIYLLNAGTCFGSNGSNGAVDPSGAFSQLQWNSADQIIPPSSFSFSFKSQAGDTITLTSTSVTGTLSGVGPNETPTLSNGLIVGYWALVPASGSGCVATSGNNNTFKMTQGSTT